MPSQIHGLTIPEIPAKISGVGLKSEERVLIRFSDATEAEYWVEELLALRTLREAVHAKPRS